MGRVAQAFLAAVLFRERATVAEGFALRPTRVQRDCDEELGGVAAKMVDIWHEFESDAVVMRQTSAGACAISEGTAPSRFTLMGDRGDMICSSNVAKPELGLKRDVVSSVLPTFQVEEFQGRNVATAWPEACTAAKPCPLVVFLHGAGEHGDDAGRLLSWGLLNYYNSDAACRQSLASVIVMPQIAESESWAADGPAVFEEFVMPFVDGLLQKNDNLDRDRVAITGYSQGGVGAVIGASLYPDVFSVLAAGSPAMPAADWKDAKAAFALPPVGGASVNPRLQQIALAYSDQDIFDTGVSLRTLMGMMQRNGLLDHSVVNVQLYTDIPHMGASEAFFNHWGSLHEMLWLGHFETQLS